jgi:putative hydrolase of the HAD superfamily
MFEDLPRNLTVPKALGMKTVLLVPQNLETTIVEWWERTTGEDDHIDYVTDDLTAFLKALV